MAEIPAEPEVTIQDLYKWFEMKKQLDLLKWQESDLRKKVVAKFFPVPKEGVNTMDLGAGYELKLTHSIDRKIDQTQLDVLKGLLVKDAHHVLKAAGYTDEQIAPLFKGAPPNCCLPYGWRTLNGEPE